ncbi:bifunctional acetate--CoA ligase family protein/GNAT family N-acetyltransferase [Pseudoduganella ginsengisoli]|uniref:GNAT family N-acetyltransferase n=1 Tax=Pseudoduganella ginsengisoli TaxID=1462440 RepID=A0A6L6Q4J5_9BURK|nr:bifunctional acetate--CoA ligase family protein/GNAT family N-acetyltransferase [Pseudoduganella ginsengisoli]MTW04630.1 GNAT family N-acetyltransferase [Pseudoduganella ginsengisoli]
MTIRNLNFLFAPRSVAVIGATERPGSVGATVLRNVLAGGFGGPIYPVNPKHQTVGGRRCYHAVAALPEAPDLALICTSPTTVPDLISQLGERGTRAAIVMTAGLGAPAGRHGHTLRQAMLHAAQPHLLRILGPNCVGLLAPHIGLNASFAQAGSTPGSLAMVSQSGAMVAAVLDWAAARGIGFSAFVSLGDCSDVDVADVLDYLAGDAETHAILLYLEGIGNARKFMSAARSAARCKPTLVLKAGRVPEGARAAATHTGALAGTDLVCDAAIRRAGMLRVASTEELFEAAETLAQPHPLRGRRLAIMTNGGGPGVMAADALVAGGGELAQLGHATLERLASGLPSNWSYSNPVDIIGDAPPERYAHALRELLAADEADAVLLIHAPTAIVPAGRIAQELAPLLQQRQRLVLCCWMGGASVEQAAELTRKAGAPVFATPEAAVEAFLQLSSYARNQRLLMEVPSSRCGPHADTVAARALVRRMLAAGCLSMGETDAKALLEAYGIPVVPTRAVPDDDAALNAAAEIGYPVVVKVLSPDVPHKSDVGGVVLDIDHEDALRNALSAIRSRLAALRPEARIAGYSVQKMVRRRQARELIAGIASDPVFGPVLLFGHGGVDVEAVADQAVALPPLNHVLAADLVSRTRVARLLGATRGAPAANMEAVYDVLVRLSQLVIDLPEVVELDVNPLLADSSGALALDARVRLAPAAEGNVRQLAIMPYPEHLEQRCTWQGEPLLLRPIRPEDGAAHQLFFSRLTAEDVRFRMFTSVSALSPAQLARFTQIDYAREMAFVAIREHEGAPDETLGVVRVVADPDHVRGEFAVTVRSDLKGRGLGRLLMEMLIGYCRASGLSEIIGEALLDNERLLELARALGFSSRHSGAGTVLLSLRLADGTGAGKTEHPAAK